MKLLDVRDDCYWYGGDCGDGSKCDTECFEPSELPDFFGEGLLDELVYAFN